MRTVKRSGFIRLVAGLLLLLMSWSMETRPAWSYPPIDDLVNEVEQLRQAGEIFDIATAANLIVSLGTIGTTIDAGDTITAKDLLSAFAQEVSF